MFIGLLHFFEFILIHDGLDEFTGTSDRLASTKIIKYSGSKGFFIGGLLRVKRYMIEDEGWLLFGSTSIEDRVSMLFRGLRMAWSDDFGLDGKLEELLILIVHRIKLSSMHDRVDLINY